jgi:hypothetical protein
LKDLSLVPGIKELDRINQYALEALTPEEKQFIEKMNKVAEDYKNEQGDFFRRPDQIRIFMLWRIYEHLKPFRFRIHPKEIIPEAFKNQTAFMIWTIWRSWHIKCNEDLIEEGSIAASKILTEGKPPFPEDVKKRAVREFRRYLHSFIAEQKGGVDGEKEEKERAFWEEHIFPYLEGKWEFKWEMAQKCFRCSKDAIAICDSISPTSSTGKTPERSFCEDCIASTLGINIVKWLVPRHEGEKEIEYALRKLKSKKIKA